MMKLNQYRDIISTHQNKIIFITLILNIIYILMTDTTSMHKIVLPSVEIWSLILLIPIMVLIIAMVEPTTERWQQVLTIAIFISTTLTLLRAIDWTYNTTVYGYAVLLGSIATLVPLYLINKESLFYYRLTLTAIIIIDLMNILQINAYNTYLGSLFELFILICIIVYLYNSKLNKMELIIIISLAVIGLGLGYFLTTVGEGEDRLVFLIIGTVFSQLLGVSQYSIFFITPQMFFALHFAEIFGLGVFLVLRKKSLIIVNIVLTGLEVTFAPLVALRALAIMIYLKFTISASS
ncbi:MAG: hypothetical protein INQ03_03235 [Candidatus Heimdallarchaeota archaeon]|nr:hypothetical protein [Candidatus Heimdallarchaeota archaeon]